MGTRPFKFLLAVTSQLLAVVAFAHSPLDRTAGADLANLAEKSNLVFVGHADKVTYRNARRANEGEGAIPYTIVTYRVDRVLRGKSPGDRVTMRFVGGPDGRGHFLTVSGVPVVQEGDQDLLFVNDTRDATCPLVYCELGRYRILNESVFDTYGSPVQMIEGSKIVARGRAPKELTVVRFPAPTFEELMRNPEVAAMLKESKMSVAEARRRYEAEAPKMTEIGEELTVPDRQEDTAPDATPTRAPDEFKPIPLAKFIEATVAASQNARRAPVAVVSIDPAAEIIPAKIKVTAPKTLEGRTYKPSASDAAEYQALQKNKMNPVLPK